MRSVIAASSAFSPAISRVLARPLPSRYWAALE
jgi:hypothetical protein